MSFESCPICMDNIGEKNNCTTICNHTFCLTCLSISLQHNISCPMCRHKLIPENKKISDLEGKLEETQVKFFEMVASLKSLVNENEHLKLIYNKAIMKVQDDKVLIERYKILIERYKKKIKSKNRIISKIEIKEMGSCKRIDTTDSPCAFCGCLSEFDDYGDRVCFCDLCQKFGCIDEKNKWKITWKHMSIKAEKELNKKFKNKYNFNKSK